MKSKIAIVILSCVSFISLVAMGLFWITASDLYRKNIELEKQVVVLQSDVELRDNVIADMEKKAYPKSFENLKILEKWLQTTSDKSHYEYYSESAVELMKEARNDGYWMGLLPLDLSVNPNSEKLVATVPLNSSGYVINLAVVAGSDLYLVDPFTGSILKSMSMQSDFDLNDLKIK